jgi:hypothetical protein
MEQDGDRRPFDSSNGRGEPENEGLEGLHPPGLYLQAGSLPAPPSKTADRSQPASKDGEGLPLSALDRSLMSSTNNPSRALVGYGGCQLVTDLSGRDHGPKRSGVLAWTRTHIKFPQFQWPGFFFFFF